MTALASTPPVVVVQTYLVMSPRNGAYYELQLASDHGDDAPRLMLVTRDAGLYQRALEAEGSDQRFRAASHVGTFHDGRRVRVLDALEAA